MSFRHGERLARAARRLARLALLMCPLGGNAGPVLNQTCDVSSYPLSTPTSRFQDHDDGTVTDTRSNLMWLRCSIGQEWSGSTCTGAPGLFSWSEAMTLAQAENDRGTHFYSDWRLPKIQELATIAERQCQNPRINLALFPQTPAAAYWTTSSRPVADGANQAAASAFVLSFGPEGVGFEGKETRHHVRLVRSGP
ncbi:MAG TPA: DUF1566 domain-containing protein [Rhizomicrobium sp.]|nr:DUF1566 domain-containing protein [Rhizomicrobium sp.]